jgi:hypothetical protein
MRPVLEARHLGRQSKHVLYIQKIQQIPRLTEEHMALYSSINRGIYGHVARAHRGGRDPTIFVGYV